MKHLINENISSYSVEQLQINCKVSNALYFMLNYLSVAKGGINTRHEPICGAYYIRYYLKDLTF